MSIFAKRSPNCVFVLAAAGAALACATLASAQCMNDKLLPSNPVAQEFNFTAGAISAERVVLGRDGVKVGSQFNQGQAQFFVRQGIDWVSDGLVTGSDSSGGDQFGWAADIDAEHAIVGAPYNVPSGSVGSGWGAAYVFDWFFFGGWTEDVKLVDPSAQAGSRFGWAVGMDGNYAVVGAPYKDIGGSNAVGAVSFFEKVGGTWTFRNQGLAPGGAMSDTFGYAVAMDANYCIVGAPSDDVSGTTDAGSAYLFHRNGVTWNYEDTINAQVISTSEDFGGSVGIHGDVAIVGARLSTVGTNTSAGIVTIFERNGGTTWVRTQTIPNPDPTNVSFFGTSVSMGANKCTITSGLPEKVFVYQPISGVWTLVDTLTDPDGGSGQFGYFAAIDQHQILVGDPADDSMVANNGAAYVYTVEENGSDSCDTPHQVGFGDWIGCNVDATTDQASGCATSGKDMWYSLLIDCTGWFQVDTEGSDFDTVLSLYEGIDCPGTLVDCDDDSGEGNTSLIQFFGVKGQYIKIRIAGYDFGGGDIRNGTFILNTARLDPFHDNCAQALPVGEGAHPFGTCRATTDGFGESLCTFFGDNQVSQDVWYTYTASCSGEATVSLCGSDYDTEIAVYSGADCPILSENPIACNDDFCGDDSQVTFNVAAGQNYKIRVGGFQTATGSGTMVISSTQSCPGDADGVSPVGVGDIAVVISNWGEAASGCNNGDLSGNGTVGLEDVALIINNWTATCP